MVKSIVDKFSNNVTGGQYSLFRVLFGLYLFIHFAHLTPWAVELFSSEGMLPKGSDSPLLFLFPNVLALIDGPVFVLGFILSAVVSSLCFMFGYKDRIAALWLWYVFACLFGRNPLIANPSMPYAGWMLLAHVFVTTAPFGSWKAKGRLSPDGGWKLQGYIFTAAWIVLAVSYSYSGYTKLFSPSWVSGDNISYVLNNPLARDYFLRDFFLWLPPIFLQLLTWTVLYVELFFAPLVLFKKMRLPMWLAMFVIQFGFAFLLNFPDLTSAMILFHIYTFNPDWLKAKKLTGEEVLYYDGNCGLCHRFVRFLLAEDRQGVFKFAPLQSESFTEALPDETREGLPDSIVLVTEKGKYLVCSDAVVYLLTRLGGHWRALGTLLWLIPKPLRDFGYNFIGSIRYKVFGKTKDSCPLMPNDLKSRFLVN